jgi:hypothetical protein
MMLFATNTNDSCNPEGLIDWKLEDDPIVECVVLHDTEVVNGLPDRRALTVSRDSQVVLKGS